MRGWSWRRAYLEANADRFSLVQLVVFSVLCVVAAVAQVLL